MALSASGLSGSSSTGLARCEGRGKLQRRDPEAGGAWMKSPRVPRHDAGRNDPLAPVKAGDEARARQPTNTTGAGLFLPTRKALAQG